VQSLRWHSVQLHFQRSRLRRHLSQSGHCARLVLRTRQRILLPYGCYRYATPYYAQAGAVAVGWSWAAHVGVAALSLVAASSATAALSMVAVFGLRSNRYSELIHGKSATFGSRRDRGTNPIMRLPFKARRLVAKSWLLSRCYYRFRGARLVGRAREEVWYFAYGANMHDDTFRIRRGIQPLECRSGRLRGYRLRFNLGGRPKGRAAPANLCLDPDAEVWGVLYRITRRDLMRLDSTEGVPGRGYRHIMVEVEDTDNRRVAAIAYMAQGKDVDGKPSLRYLMLLRDGARAHGLPEQYIRFLEDVEPAY